jgi:hypothetical protein
MNFNCIKKCFSQSLKWWQWLIFGISVVILFIVLVYTYNVPIVEALLWTVGWLIGVPTTKIIGCFRKC